MPTARSDPYSHLCCLFCSDLGAGRGPPTAKTARRSNNNGDEPKAPEGSQISDKAKAQPRAAHPTLRTVNVVSVTLWTAQPGSRTVAGKDRDGRGRVARRVTENSPSAFLKQMLSS